MASFEASFTETELRSTISSMILRENTVIVSIQGVFRQFIFVIVEELLTRIELIKAKKGKMELYHLEDMLMHEINQFSKHKHVIEGRWL